MDSQSPKKSFKDFCSLRPNLVAGTIQQYQYSLYTSYERACKDDPQ